MFRETYIRNGLVDIYLRDFMFAVLQSLYLCPFMTNIGDDFFLIRFSVVPRIYAKTKSTRKECVFGTYICSTCWDQSFSELVVILPDYALRISLGTFSILLYSSLQKTIILLRWSIANYNTENFFCSRHFNFTIRISYTDSRCFIFSTTSVYTLFFGIKRK